VDIRAQFMLAKQKSMGDRKQQTLKTLVSPFFFFAYLPFHFVENV
jgi:hypothetical protein